MSSPFQKAFSAKSPLHNHGDKFLQKAKKLSEKGGQGQGGYDYENDKVMKLKAKGEEKNASHSNSEDQDVDQIEKDRENSQKDASMANYGVREKKTEAVTDNNKKPLSPSEQKLMHATQSVTNKAILGQEYSGKVGAIINAPKKNGSVNQMRSPLHGDYYNPKAKQSTILSEVGMINKATDDVAKAAMSIANESASSKAKRQGKRVDNRNKRGVNKGEGTIDATTGVYTANNPNSKFNEKTVKISKKAEKNKTTANKNKTSNNENTFSKWLDKNSTASQAVIDAKKASLGIT